MKLLVTGNLGLVGSACVDLFSAKGWEVIGIDNNGRNQFFGTKRKIDSRPYWNVDLTDSTSIEIILSDTKFDAIIHAAAQPSHDYATDHVLEDFDVNTRSTVRLLEATRKFCPDATFVYVSTDKVYGENMQRLETIFKPKGFGKEARVHAMLEERETQYHSEFPFDESLGLDFAGDRSFFGCSKAAADMYAQQYAARFGMKVGIFRPGCITGRNHAGAEQHGFLSYLAKCIKNGQTYKIFGTGKSVRDQIHASDIAGAFSCFMDRPQVGAVYNIGGGPERSFSVLEAGELLSKAIGKPFLYEFHEARKGDRLWDVHDVSKFRRDYPEWDYKYSLSDIIADLC